ncbi:hypothetical protein GCM10010123_46330 [Pilimelia anulata]|uniref:Uncharacterized protein n=1 Tax=Pilimelia anulata TaxID=53371 RepID=A0A8J3FDG6_9ACTN|nr:WD40 repeat domain-containing protein [Pilimelia anulata]GGK11092.1 hypothetical protein GCM10010123_46330 [Pilimelia anulata]
MSRVYELDVTALPVRPVSRASMALGITPDKDRQICVVYDIERDEFVRPPSMPDGSGWSLLSLSPDGTQLLYLDLYGPRRPDNGLYLYTLATAEHVRFDPPDITHPDCAAVSPDGRTIATLTGDISGKPIATIHLLDVATGRWRQVWQEPGLAAVLEGVVAWSPDGSRLAATYGIGPGWGTVVLDSAGRKLAYFDETLLPSSGNSAWLDNRRVLCRWDEPGGGRNILNTEDGSREVLDGSSKIPTARFGDRLFPGAASYTPNRGITMSTTDMHGGDTQPFMTLPPNTRVLTFHTWLEPPT